MNRRIFAGTLLAGGAALATSNFAQAAPATDSDIISSSDAWIAFRAEINGKPDALGELREEADRILKEKRFSVVDKEKPPASKDPHDYSSLGPYWWPDPAKPGGLPYIRKDGEVNPEYYKTDRTRLTGMCDAVNALTLFSYASTTSAAHAQQAGRLLRAWFLDEATRMNPNLNFGQAIPGRTEGRGTGIIDTMAFSFLLDALPHLERSSEWTAAHETAVRDWFAKYLDWMLNSKIGKEEAAAINNHGTWYDAQVAVYAMFCGKPDIARDRISKSSIGRVRAQFGTDGSQPMELARTLSLTYSTFNLLGHVCIANMAQRLGIDAWGWKKDGRSLIGAIRYHLPYYLGQKKWEHQQIKEFRGSTAALLLNLAARGSGDPEIVQAASALACKPWNRISLFGAALRYDRQGE